MRNFIENRTARYLDSPSNLDSPRCRDKIDAILDEPDGYKVTDEYNHDDVRHKLRTHFGIKCIYCESSPIATSTFRIDHFRPKKGIRGTAHTGYYWLAYEWTNLLQSCQLCNGKKSNYFPLEDPLTRVYHDTPHATEKIFRNPTKSPLADERRSLLHPELDEVEKHFYFNADGTISSYTVEGAVSISCYDLQRDDLVFSRKKIKDEILEDIKEALKRYEGNLTTESPIVAKKLLFDFLEDKFRKLLISFKSNRPFSLFSFYMFDCFEEFFVAEVKIPEHKDLLLEAYNSYKRK